MAETIQFQCPVCGTKLSLPLSLAGQQGPCPQCAREIIAPDPRWGLAAQEVAIAMPMPEPEPFQPFLESSLPPAPAPPEIPAEAIPETIPETLPETVAETIPDTLPEPPPTVKLEPAAVEPAPPARAQRPWTLVWSCLLTGSVAMVWGYALGVRASPNHLQTPPAQAAAPTEATPPPAVAVRVLPAQVAPPAPTPAPEVAKAPEPQAVSAAAEASLRAFLEAPDWAARLAHILQPEKMRAAMEAYSHEVPDGPTPFQSISVQQSHIDEKTGLTLYLFFVKTSDFPGGIPVAVQETAGGWLVDWQAFVEFRDGLFQKFADGPAGRNGRFHVSVSAPPAERAAATENEHFSSYLLQSPLAKTPQLAFVRKGSDIAATFVAALSSTTPFTPVLEVAKRQTSEGQGYLEVVKIVSTNWLPAGN